MNRDLGTALDLDAIEHVAWYDRARDRVEIYARFTQAGDDRARRRSGRALPIGRRRARA
mgnify:CR=1 FL=1